LKQQILFGLSNAATGEAIQAFATYLGLTAAFVFARPAVRVQDLARNLLLLEATGTGDPRAEQIRRDALDAVRGKLITADEKSRRDNMLALILLGLSAVVFAVGTWFKLAS
jgi:hypothetical protein